MHLTDSDSVGVQWLFSFCESLSVNWLYVDLRPFRYYPFSLGVLQLLVLCSLAIEPYATVTSLLKKCRRVSEVTMLISPFQSPFGKRLKLFRFVSHK